MKILGLGTDIIEVERILRFSHTPGALERIFSKKEIAYCLARKNKGEHLAVRFAAKEAVYKALPFDGVAFTDIEVFNEESGAPRIKINDVRCAKMQILISLSHTAQYAVATVVIQQ